VKYLSFPPFHVTRIVLSVAWGTWISFPVSFWSSLQSYFNRRNKKVQMEMEIKGKYKIRAKGRSRVLKVQNRASFCLAERGSKILTWGPQGESIKQGVFVRDPKINPRLIGFT
jgi:hypothetical protein